VKQKILVFIPAYRCEKQVVRVLDQFDNELQGLVDTVVVVDNRSPDNTIQVAIDKAQEKFTSCNFIAWLNNDNYGLGGSHKAAFRYAIDNQFDYLIVLHGDDQADIRDLKSLLNDGSYTSYDCVLGARFMPGSKLIGYSKFRTFGNCVYNKLFSLVAWKNIYDLGSGLNLYRLESFRDFYYKKFPDNLTFNYVMLLASYSRKQSVKFFPISWREEDQRSNVKLFSQAATVLALLFRYFLFRSVFLKKEMRAINFETYSGEIKYSNSQNINEN
jgi:glycosyltransferase involved in cell wall biosynthesis